MDISLRIFYNKHGILNFPPDRPVLVAPFVSPAEYAALASAANRCVNHALRRFRNAEERKFAVVTAATVGSAATLGLGLLVSVPAVRWYLERQRAAHAQAELKVIEIMDDLHSDQWAARGLQWTFADGRFVLRVSEGALQALRARRRSECEELEAVHDKYVCVVCGSSMEKAGIVWSSSRSRRCMCSADASEDKQFVTVCA